MSKYGIAGGGRGTSKEPKPTNDDADYVIFWGMKINIKFLRRNQ